jgi:hypothetical protein
MPGAFSISGSPITTNGTFTVTWGASTIPVANLGTGSAVAANFLNGSGAFSPALTNMTTTISGFSITNPTSTPALGVASGAPSGGYLDSTGAFSVPPFVDPIPFAIALG